MSDAENSFKFNTDAHRNGHSVMAGTFNGDSIWSDWIKMRTNLKGNEGNGKKVYFFGHFGMFNSGNESTLQSILYNLRRFLPKAEIACICDRPEVVAVIHNIKAIPICDTVVKPIKMHGFIPRLFRKLFVRIPNELYQWFRAFRTLIKVDMLIIPGTGLLTDAYGLSGWGPYNLFKWSLMAKLCRCKLFFVSVGAGPIYTPLGKFLVRSALSSADFRSYRDQPSMKYAEGIGLCIKNDRVYPDLVFSMPEAVLPQNENRNGRRRVVGLGLMEYAGSYSVANPNNKTRAAYLECLVLFVKWLLTNDYDVRLLIGDTCDTPVIQEFKTLLKKRLDVYDEERILDVPTVSVEQILLQLAATDIVVATRFHNVLLALLLQKPVVAISFHHKCTSLMSQMGLAEYCHDINSMSIDKLIEQFQNLEKRADEVKPIIRQKVEQARRDLGEQYSLIFKNI